MRTITVHFLGGAFDGQTEHWPISESLDWTLTIRPDHDPAVLAVYGLRSITLSAPPVAVYQYRQTLPAAAA
ncbi:hypothetical protein ABZT02_07635 [Streptomyces sp. NPDC005402]|uniref:hypothetical protein n=1 Tax=Streptomyces sp. NPDC005402 TaxID=3155338 RepID=UPI0033BBB3DA